MANRVTVTVNVRDNSRAGLAALRGNVNRIRSDLSGQDIRFRVTIPPGSARRVAAQARRIRQQLGDDVIINTRVVPPDRNRFRRMITRTLTSPIRSAGGFLGGLLSDGLGQGIIGAFKAAGPVGMAVLASIIAGSLAVVGAALSGLLVAALGLAFVGVAGVSAAMSEEVKDTWSKALGSLKKDFASVGEPLIPVLQEAIGQLESLSARVAPKFRQAMVEAAPSIEEFIDKMFSAFERFGKAAFDPIMDAWRVFGPIFGDAFGTFLEDIGKNFAEIADMVREHSVEIEMALRAVFKILSGLIEVINFLGETWIAMVRGMNTAVSILLNYGIIPLAKGALNAFGAIISGAEKGFGWIPGVGDMLAGAGEAFDKFKNQAISDLEATGRNAASANKRLDELNRTRVLKADIKSWSSSISSAKEKLRSVPTSKQSKIKADISNLQAKVRAAKVELAMIRDRVVNVTVRNLYDSSLNRHAKGGNVGTAATGGVRANMTLVGEQGPEIVDVAPGSHVRSNPDTRRLLAGKGTGGAQVVHLTVMLGGHEVGKAVVDLTRKEVANRGGNVQTVLGQRGRS